MGGGLQVVQIRFKGPPGTTHGAPQADEMANISMGPHGACEHGYHITVQERQEGQAGNHPWRNQRLWLGMPHFQEMQYPTLFPCGSGGWYRYYDKVFQVCHACSHCGIASGRALGRRPAGRRSFAALQRPQPV